MFFSSASRYEYRLYRRNRRRRRLAFFLLVACLLAGAAVSHHARPAHGHRASGPARTARPVSRERSRIAETGGAALAGTRAATHWTGLHWTSFHGIDLPASAADGPRHNRHGLARGFTDSPRGALLAAVNIAVRTAAQWGPAIYRPTISRQVTGPGKAALLRSDDSQYAALRAAAGVRRGQPAGRGYATEVAYRFTAWSANRAVVEIVSQGPGSSGGAATAATRIRLVWRGGDWRVLAPPGGDWAGSASAVTSLAGYVTFPDER